MVSNEKTNREQKSEELNIVGMDKNDRSSQCEKKAGRWRSMPKINENSCYINCYPKHTIAMGMF